MKFYNKIIYIIIIFFNSCNLTEIENSTDLSQAIPTESDVIVKIYDYNKLYQKIELTNWWESLREINALNNNITKIENIRKKIDFQKILHNRAVYISSMLVGKNRNELLFLTSAKDLNLESINMLVSNKKTYEKTIIKNIFINENVNFFYAIKSDILIASFSELIVEKSIRQINSSHNLFDINLINKIERNLPKYSDLNILIKTNFVEEIIGQNNIFLNKNTWSFCDVEIDNNYILLNGVTDRGTTNYLNTAKYNDANTTHIERILPRHITGFYKYQINNITDLNNVINNISSGIDQNTYHLSNQNCHPNELNIAYADDFFQDIAYIIFKSNDLDNCMVNIDLTNKITHLNYDIYNHNDVNQHNEWFQKINSNWKDGFFTIIDSYYVYAQSEQEIKSLINNIVSQQTIGNNKAIKLINSKLGKNSHTSLYLNFNNPLQEWKKIFNTLVSKNISSKDYFFNSMLFLNEHTTYSNPTKWNFFMNTNTIYKPQIVLNHKSGGYEIISQDIENNLYLLNSKGEKIWKKQLGHQIIGDIHQIDSYKNNKLQYLFNTSDSIYLIDRNGEHVSPFPFKSIEEMSIPLALFEYDNNRSYRILVSMNNKLQMFDGRGNIIEGWSLKEVSSKINLSPILFQLFDKEYIMISEENGKLHFLNRKGQERIHLKQKINLSKNPVSVLKSESEKKSKLLALTNKGLLIYINLNGSTDTLKVQNLSPEDIYIINDNLTVILKGRKLSIMNNETQFEYNFKSNPVSVPKIIYKNNGQYLIGVQHESENSIYLFNQNGKIKTQPFFGTTDFSIGKLENDSIYNLIVGSEEGVIYNYIIN